MIFSKINSFLKEKTLISRVVIFGLLTLPILAFGFGFLQTGNQIVAGDGDYYIQLYEASRISILDYGQIPWWNPWMSGGVPLFANPQFGPISIQMITSLLFGSVFGSKLALILYLVLGFWGLRKLLLGYFKSDPIIAILLSYIWIFSSFFVYRIGGHYTFFVIGFVPWMVYFFLERANGKNWLWLALFSSAIVWSSMHYTTTLSFFILGLFGIYQFYEVFPKIWSKKTLRKKWSAFLELMAIKKLVYAVIVTAILCAPRVYATLEYAQDFPRIQSFIKEESIGLDNTLYAMFDPDQHVSPPIQGDWGWHEISTYIGLLTAVAFVIALVYFFKTKKGIPKKRSGFLLVLIIFFLLLAQGDFAPWAPYTLLRELPVFSSMRVATRWINWASIFILMFIASVKIGNKRYKSFVTLLLGATMVELFISGYPRLSNSYFIDVVYHRDNSTFVQYSHWMNKRWGIPYDENFTEATRNNVGQIIAGDSLVDTRQPNSTVRCDESIPPCTYVSNNATVTSWTPNKIVLERTAPGAISMNINPGSHWEINGVKNRSYKVVDSKAFFIITDESQTITIEYRPPFLPHQMLTEAVQRVF